jgi:hypothetical protein
MKKQAPRRLTRR